MSAIPCLLATHLVDRPWLQREAEEAAAAEAAAAAEEEERQARLREEYEAAIPEEVAEQVQIALDKELVSGGEGLMVAQTRSYVLLIAEADYTQLEHMLLHDA
jgi:hypothetical protein